MKALKRHCIVLDIPGSVALLIIFAKHVAALMAASAWFPNPTLSYATFLAHIDELIAAEILAKAKTVGAAEAREVKRKQVEDDLWVLAAYTESIVRANADQAEAIAKAAGLSLRQPAMRSKAALQARMGDTPGEAIVRAKAYPKRRAAYEWQISHDGGQTWVAIAITTFAETRVSGLTALATYQFRYRTIVGAKTSAWSQSVSLRIV